MLCIFPFKLGAKIYIDPSTHLRLILIWINILLNYPEIQGRIQINVLIGTYIPGGALWAGDAIFVGWIGPACNSPSGFSGWATGPNRVNASARFILSGQSPSPGIKRNFPESYSDIKTILLVFLPFGGRI